VSSFQGVPFRQGLTSQSSLTDLDHFVLQVRPELFDIES
jgi:hypothetical protein